MKSIIIVLLCIIAPIISLHAEKVYVEAKTKIIIDTDPGGDDAIAIMVAANDPKLQIMAITPVSGNPPLEDAITNTIYLLAMIDRTDIPVYAGASKPLKKEQKFDFFFGPHALGTYNFKDALKPLKFDSPEVAAQKEKLNELIKEASSHNAVDEILSIVKENPHEITIVCLAPLTNIAKAIQKDPETMKLVKDIIISGGSLFVPGNITKFAEFNYYVDPDAIDIVLNADVKKVLMTTDTVEETGYKWKELIDDLKPTLLLRDPLTNETLSVKDFLTKMLEFENGKKILDKEALYDPLAVYVAAKGAKTYDCFVSVDTSGTATRAKSTPDCKKQPGNVEVAHIIPKKSFKNFLLKYLE